jgi:hypothetical protein
MPQREAGAWEWEDLRFLIEFNENDYPQTIDLEDQSALKDIPSESSEPTQNEDPPANRRRSLELLESISI